jgi:thioredoxin 1
MIISVTEKNFEQVIKDNEIVFVDFWAQWCAPCKTFSIIYEKIAKKYPSITFGNIDIQDEKTLAETFHIASIPHLMIFKQEIAIYSESGAMPESRLEELISQAITADVSEIKAKLAF